MSNEHLLIVMTAFVIVAAVALVVQMGLLIGMYRTSNAMKKQVADLAEKAEPLIAKLGPIADTSQRLLEEIRRYSGEISEKANDLLDLSRKQLGRVDEVLSEATTRTRAQMDRIEMVMDDTVNRFQETTALIQNGIVRPLRQIGALTSGLRAALSFFLGGRRATVEQATHDEEMFI